MSYQNIVIGNVATQMRKQCITQNQLAKRMKVSKSTLSLFMNGKTSPRLDFLEKLSLALSVPLSFLFDTNNFDQLSKNEYIYSLDDKIDKGESCTILIHIPAEKVASFQHAIKNIF